jgi:hypothetical protein
LVSCFFVAFVLCLLISFRANQAEGQVLDIKPCYECTNCLINPDTSEPEPPLGETAIWIPCPGPSSINLCSNGVTAVAVLAASGEFDGVTSAAATFQIDTSVVPTAPQASSVRWALQDVNFDGMLDLVFHFITQDLAPHDHWTDRQQIQACLDGTASDGINSTQIADCDDAIFFFKGCDKGPKGQNNQIRNRRGPKK